MSKFIQTSKVRFQATKTSLRNQETSIHNLENQIGQLVNLISRRQQGSLPGNTELNPKKLMKAMSLKGGKEMRGREFSNLVREDYNLQLTTS